MKTHRTTLDHKFTIGLPETMRKLTPYSRASGGGNQT